MADTKTTKAGDDTLERIRERAEEFRKTLPHCLGYPDCDGDVIGISHSKECPMLGKADLDYMQFAVLFAESAIAAEREQCCKDVCKSCADEVPLRQVYEWYWTHEIPGIGIGPCQANPIRTAIRNREGSEG